MTEIAGGDSETSLAVHEDEFGNAHFEHERSKCSKSQMSPRQSTQTFDVGRIWAKKSVEIHLEWKSHCMVEAGQQPLHTIECTVRMYNRRGQKMNISALD